MTPASPSPKHLSLKPTVKPSHSLLFFLTRSSDASVEVMKSIFIWNTVVKAWQAFGSSRGYTVYLDVYKEKIFLSFVYFLSSNIIAV